MRPLAEVQSTKSSGLWPKYAACGQSTNYKVRSAKLPAAEVRRAKYEVRKRIGRSIKNLLLADLL